MSADAGHDTLKRCILNKFKKEGWHVEFEVTNGTGADSSRRCDAMALGIWPCRGLSVTGFEIKTTRGDWLKELKSPEKAHEFVPYCDYWYIVVPTIGEKGRVVEEGELPENWGLMVKKGTSVRIVKEAPRLDQNRWDRKMVAAFVQRMLISHGTPLSEADYEAAYREGVKHGEKTEKKHVETLQAMHDQLSREVNTFQKDTGIYINRNTSKDLGASLSAMENLRHRGVWKLDEAEGYLSDAAKKLTALQADIAKVKAQGSEGMRQMGILPAHTAELLPSYSVRGTLEDIRDAGHSVVFTNGCFDLLHAGHVHLLTEAKKLGDFLVVGVNSDESVRDNKSGPRPVIGLEQRVEMLLAQAAVDYVVTFDEESVERLVREVRPDVLVKGGEYDDDGVVGGAHVLSYGGTVVRVPMKGGVSTTDLISRIVCDFEGSMI